MLRWLGTINFLSFQDHLIKPRNFISLSPGENAMTIWFWWSSIFYYRVNIPSNEENSFDEFIIIIVCKPHINKLLWQRLNELRNLQLTKFLFLHDNICFSCLWWFSKLVWVGCFVCHSSEFVSCFLNLKNATCMINLLILVLSFEFFLASNINDCLNQSQTLFETINEYKLQKYKITNFWSKHK